MAEEEESSGTLEPILVAHIISYGNHYNSTAAESLRPGQRLSALVAAACLLHEECSRKVAHAYLAYVLMLLQELEDQEKAVELLLTHMCKAGASLATLGRVVHRMHSAEESNNRLKGRNRFSKKDDIRDAAMQRIEQDLLLGRRCIDIDRNRLDQALQRLFAKDPRDDVHGAATLQETVAGERMSWTVLLAPFSSSARGADASIAGCMNKIVTNLMDYNVLRELLLNNAAVLPQMQQQHRQALDEDDKWGDSIPAPDEVKNGSVIANRIGVELAALEMEDSIYNNQVDSNMIRDGPNQPNVSFSVQYGIACMLVNVVSSRSWMVDLSSSNPLFGGDSGSATTTKVNHMSARDILALVRQVICFFVGSCFVLSIKADTHHQSRRVSCDLPANVLRSWQEQQQQQQGAVDMLDAATEALLMRPVQLYEIRSYVVWKSLVCTAAPPFLDAPANSEDRRRREKLAFGNRKLADGRRRIRPVNWDLLLPPPPDDGDSDDDDSNNGQQQQRADISEKQRAYRILDFKHEWLDLKGELKLSQDLLLMWRALLIREGLAARERDGDDDRSRRRVGHFVMYKVNFCVCID